jgi:tetratricopeptide (TPR) repeat protein
MLIGGFGFSIHYGEAGETISSSIAKKIIMKQIEKDPTNPDLYQVMGDVYYSEKDYEKTVNAYLAALKYNPEQIHALNNLAWLFATSEDDSYKRPQKAVELAEQAAGLSQESYILDTLAESYFANGNTVLAVQYAEQALSHATHNHSYYRDQLAKFENAAQRQ